MRTTTATATFMTSLMLVSSLALAQEPSAPSRHANGEHPAVLVARRAPAVDPNTYLVQPPATTRWTVNPEARVLASAEVRAKPAKASKAQ